MRVLDLFCGGGGVAEGFIREGWDVVGVDIRKTRNYPGEFIQANALNVDLDGFDLLWASPPCQGYSNHVSSDNSVWAGTRGKAEPRLIPLVRRLFQESDTPYVIENVSGARPELVAPVQYCGVYFGLPISRHRYFETSWGLKQPGHPACKGVAKQYAERRGWEYRDMTVTGKGRHAGTSDRWREIMGIEHHMTQHEIRESIPPVYAQAIARSFLNRD